MGNKENFDDFSMFCGPKEFYDLDGDGHLDAFEAGMMLGDVSDELEEFERMPWEDTSPPITQNGGCLRCSIKSIFIWGIIFWMIGKILHWE